MNTRCSDFQITAAREVTCVTGLYCRRGAQSDVCRRPKENTLTRQRKEDVFHILITLESLSVWVVFFSLVTSRS